VNQATLDLALKKQRLQIASDTLRADFGLCATGLGPAFRGADCAAEGARWLLRNPQFVVAAAVALAVVRPKRVWRWARRTFVGWQVWRKVRDLLEYRQPPISQR